MLRRTWPSDNRPRGTTVVPRSRRASERGREGGRGVALQVCMTAMIKCSFGVAPSPLVVVPEGPVVMASGLPAATIMEFVPMANIPPFGMCSCPSNPEVAAATTARLHLPVRLGRRDQHRGARPGDRPNRGAERRRRAGCRRSGGRRPSRSQGERQAHPCQPDTGAKGGRKAGDPAARFATRGLPGRLVPARRPPSRQITSGCPVRCQRRRAWASGWRRARSRR